MICTHFMRSQMPNNLSGCCVQIQEMRAKNIERFHMATIWFAQWSLCTVKSYHSHLKSNMCFFEKWGWTICLKRYNIIVVVALVVKRQLILQLGHPVHRYQYSFSSLKPSPINVNLLNHYLIRSLPTRTQLHDDSRDIMARIDICWVRDCR